MAHLGWLLHHLLLSGRPTIRFLVDIGFLLGRLDLGGAPGVTLVVVKRRVQRTVEHCSSTPRGAPYAEAWCALGCLLAASYRLRADRFVHAWLASFRS